MRLRRFGWRIQSTVILAVLPVALWWRRRHPRKQSYLYVRGPAD